MVEYAESLINKRRTRLFEKKVHVIKKRTDLKVDYQLKSNFVDRSIEKDIKFFKSTNLV